MSCRSEIDRVRLELFSATRKARGDLICVAGRTASWWVHLRPVQILALLVTLAVVVPPGSQLSQGASKFLMPLRTFLIPFGGAVETPHLSRIEGSEVRLSPSRITLGREAPFSTVPPIRHDRSLVVTTNYRYRSAAHTLALLRAPPVA